MLLHRNQLPDNHALPKNTLPVLLCLRQLSPRAYGNSRAITVLLRVLSLHWMEIHMSHLTPLSCSGDLPPQSHRMRGQLRCTRTVRQRLWPENLQNAERSERISTLHPFSCSFSIPLMWFPAKTSCCTFGPEIEGSMLPVTNGSFLCLTCCSVDRMWCVCVRGGGNLSGVLL